ncbi:hypothetical protein Tdes44962_MAKER04374 [Teratosphaeria destructans]|uniref:Uncharacterized protein n=1 Tax=Teratosphaeria destructans TaxID=418781 RepID=A0A9W7SMU0_9PEZI|nr:hypothetical protein Tdes44962_MAKER04374 [Teratosphaeria destructans]
MADPPPIDVDSSGLPPDMPPVGKPSALSSYSDSDSLSDVSSTRDSRSFAWDITSLDIDEMSDEAIVDGLQIHYLVRVDKKHLDRDVEEPREPVV